MITQMPYQINVSSHSVKLLIIIEHHHKLGCKMHVNYSMSLSLVRTSRVVSRVRVKRGLRARHGLVLGLDELLYGGVCNSCF